MTLVRGIVKVDIWSDIACPWCYIGKRRFEEGVRRYRAAGGDNPIEIEYHSFELSPDTPVDFDGNEADFLSRHKGIPAEQARAMLDRVSGLAAAEGLGYDFDALQHTNTLKAHQLLHLAKEHGVQLDLAERLFRAYFIEGRHVGRDDDLAELATDVGLDRRLALAALRDGSYAEAVRRDIAQARGYGISGVPFYVLDARYGVSGAQDPDVFARALAQAADDTSVRA